MSKMMNITFEILIKIFGFWNVYYFPKNLRCLFVGHKWFNEENFEIKSDEKSFGEFSLITCKKCGFHKWQDSSERA